MARKSKQPRDADTEQPGTELAVLVTPHEVQPGRVSATARVGAAIAKGSQMAGRVAGNAVRATTETARASSGAAAKAAGNVASGAAATFHFVGDLNGDGRADAEDLRIAKAAIGKAAVELGGEAMNLSKAAMRHPLVKDAAAGALVGGAVAAVVPLVGVPFGAAVGAAMVLAKGAAGEVVDKTASGAAGLANQALKAASKPKRRKPRAKPKA